MRILKFTFRLLLVTLIISAIIFYLTYTKYNLNNIISKVEKNSNIEIEINEKEKWLFFPTIKLVFSSKIQDNINKYYSEKIFFSFEQPYKLSPINIDIKSNAFFIRGLEIKLLKLLADYTHFSNDLFINKLSGKINNGSFNVKGSIKELDTKDKQIILKGNLNNLYLNQILKQLNLADWHRIEIRLSSNNFNLSSQTTDANKLQENLKGEIPINGSIYFVTTEEERFGISLLNLLVEKMLPDYRNLSKSLSLIINNFSDAPALFKGTLMIKNGKIYTSNLSVKNKNNNNKIYLEGYYDFINDFFNTKLSFIESSNVQVEARISGNLENPSIEIINDNEVINNNQLNNDLKKVIEEGIGTLIDNLLNLNE